MKKLQLINMEKATPLYFIEHVRKHKKRMWIASAISSSLVAWLKRSRDGSWTNQSRIEYGLHE